MKKLILISAFLLLASTAHARDKWTGPTSPTDPMWGLTGSSLMSEALRKQPQPNPLADMEREDEIKRAYEKGKREGSKGSENFGILLYGDK